MARRTALAIATVGFSIACCAARADVAGGVVAWGSNSHAQCDIPLILPRTRSITAGLYSTAALSVEDHILCWGSGSGAGFCGYSTTPSTHSLVSGGEHMVALLTDGSVQCWGANGLPSGEYAGQCNVPRDLPPIVQVAAGGYHSLALTDSGQVRGWGWNAYGQCNTPSYGDFVAIAGGGYHTIGLRSNGEVVCWGGNFSGQCSVPVLPPAVAVAAGGQHSVALLEDGSVRCWGSNINGQLNVPADLGVVVAISAGLNHTVALTETGMVRCWGDNSSYGQCNVPADLATVAEIAAGGRHTVARLMQDCDLDGWDDVLAIRDGGVADCDGDYVPDECAYGQIGTTIQSPFDAAHPCELATPANGNSESDVQVRIRVRASLDGPLRFLTLRMNETVIATPFVLDGGTCGDGEQLASVTISAKQYQQAAQDGQVHFSLTASGAVAAGACLPSRAALGVFIASEPRDCDGNGVADYCDIASNPRLDLNNDGRLDSCDVSRGDFDLDGLVGGSDLAVLLSLWGVVDPPIGDLTGDGVVNGADLANLLGNWGS